MAVAAWGGENLRAELAPTVAQAQACKDKLAKKVDVAINELQGNLETLRENLCKLAEQAQTTRIKESLGLVA